MPAFTRPTRTGPEDHDPGGSEMSSPRARTLGSMALTPSRACGTPLSRASGRGKGERERASPHGRECVKKSLRTGCCGCAA